ncbi:esterase-like activity of phytase family protein [Rhodococcus sp. ACT016]|uniref:esterase-like activity of phytase family protein n=1 Tax=Rhodococcus sp. ACT016 TaxID=3134808 RepID=UPI003D29D320
MTIPQLIAAGVVALASVSGVLPGAGSLGTGSLDTGSLAGATPPAHVGYVDNLTIPDDLSFGGYPVGGLSGIDFDRASGEFVAISDNRGEAGPVRLYTLGLPLVDGKLSTARFDSMVSLLDTDGAPYARRAADTESVRWLPHQARYVYTSEGEAKIGRPGFVREAGIGGEFVRDVPLPDHFTPRLDDNGTLVSGIRDNLGFEGMTLSADGRRVVAVSENALVQDGPAASTDGTSPSRLLVLDRASGADLGEFVYPVDAVPPGGMPEATGVAEILAADDGAFLTLERTMIPGRGFTGKIYWTTTAGADDVAGVPALTGSERPMRKELLFDFGSVTEDSDCIEGITWGPRLPDGSRSLVVVADNNFGLAGRTTFHLLSVSD